MKRGSPSYLMIITGLILVGLSITLLTGIFKWAGTGFGILLLIAGLAIRVIEKLETAYRRESSKLVGYLN